MKSYFWQMADQRASPTHHRTALPPVNHDDTKSRSALTLTMTKETVADSLALLLILLLTTAEHIPFPPPHT